ncbi:uncharacterized protein PODANS_1_10650 [Podospora anserina S mat+]|uniref:Podospora anserina S mat+ genomic DNA chromosome 1, supercontig 2 n=1 Tax=Podospora anserina (strain S / ATCC MYA-4624 / DSM 980 / FGSC 10383) TaxID=515849 RepID=B2AYC6_PODAN|nr:uncharacterized protein PODANS_1_10650 [Podospora anserina S mat+]CAP69400.1 unnamed protein product [Podospora anserina S mat+]CDP23423.1 Putative protein of unknown function [Podospora anserina S mat+]
MKDRASDPLKVDPLKAISLSSPTRIRHQTASFKLLTKPQCSSMKSQKTYKCQTFNTHLRRGRKRSPQAEVCEKRWMSSKLKQEDACQDSNHACTVV